MEDSKNFASFMYQLVLQVVGSKDEIFNFLGIISDPVPGYYDKYGSNFLDDEEFDE